MSNLRSALLRLAFALAVTTAAGGVYGTSAHGQDPDEFQSSIGQEEGIEEDSAGYAGGLCRIWCVTHNRHELIRC